MSTSKHITRATPNAAAKSSPGETQAKRDVTRLMSAIIDGLEDVKAQDIVVFDTEHLSSLFERVIVASGTSNRQTKALASSVRDAVREAGFGKPRIEGEDNGEWIIVDCGPAVAHIMQPAIRQYYHLEDIWGEKPVKLKNATAKGLGITAGISKQKEASARMESAKSAPKKVASKKSAAAKPGAKTTGTTGTAAVKTAAKKAPPKKTGIAAAAKSAVAKKAAGKTAAKKAPAKKAAAKKS
jgi:ribosome-associated protein